MDFYRRFKFLVCVPGFDPDELEGIWLQAIVSEVERQGLQVVRAHKVDDGELAIRTDAAIGLILVDWGKKGLESKAAGYLDLVRSCNGDAKAAATLLMTEKIEQIVQLQVEAIRNIKIDKITVWDSAGAGADGTATANFLAGMIKCLPPLHDVAGLAGIELPKYLGHVMAETDRRIEP